ncbi:SPASM domain-containing protein [Helicobacter sp. T3_23-1059]
MKVLGVDMTNATECFFSTVISADFKVWACLHFRQSAKHFLGDLEKQSLEEIWRGARIREVYNAIDCAKCPILCRNDSFNRTLNKLSLDITNSEFL